MKSQLSLVLVLFVLVVGTSLVKAAGRLSGKDFRL
jgi:hypothetical protein